MSTRCSIFWSDKIHIYLDVLDNEIYLSRDTEIIRICSREEWEVLKVSKSYLPKEASEMIDNRDKEIEEAAKKAFREHCPPQIPYAFIVGAKWADKNPQKYPYLSNIDDSGGHGSVAKGIKGLSWKHQVEKEAQAHIQTAGTLQGIIEKLESRIMKLRAGLEFYAAKAIIGQTARAFLKEDKE